MMHDAPAGHELLPEPWNNEAFIEAYNACAGRFGGAPYTTVEGETDSLEILYETGNYKSVKAFAEAYFLLQQRS